MILPGHRRCLDAVRAAIAKAGYPPAGVVVAREEPGEEVEILTASMRDFARLFRGNEIMSEALSRATTRRDEHAGRVLVSLLLVSDGWVLVTEIAEDAAG